MPHRRDLTVRTGTVSLLEWTPDEPTGSDILLLHGGGLDSAELSWGETGPALAAAGHRVFAADHPGFGQSVPWSQPITQERLVAHVGDLVDALELDAPVVGGISMGGGMTIGHLLARPSTTRAAILLGTYGVMPRLPLHLLSWLLVRSGILPGLTHRYARDTASVERSLRPLVRDATRRTPALVSAVLAEARGTAADSFGQWQVDQVLPTRLRTDYSTRLLEIDVPVLLVHGARDTGVPVARARAAAEAIPGARLVVVPDAGHWVQRDRPDIVHGAVLDFLTTVR